MLTHPLDDVHAFNYLTQRREALLVKERISVIQIDEQLSRPSSWAGSGENQCSPRVRHGDGIVLEVLRAPFRLNFRIPVNTELRDETGKNPESPTSFEESLACESFEPFGAYRSPVGSCLDDEGPRLPRLPIKIFHGKLDRSPVPVCKGLVWSQNRNCGGSESNLVESVSSAVEVAGFDIRKSVNCLAVRSPHPHLPVVAEQQVVVRAAFNHA